MLELDIISLEDGRGSSAYVEEGGRLSEPRETLPLEERRRTKTTLPRTVDLSTSDDDDDMAYMHYTQRKIQRDDDLFIGMSVEYCY